ncbi:MAG: zf-HC2 domain-containing protein [Thermoleophilia bacterium]|nr:zf-HC2 domain-containing protein [Thermoleophilia bacterium]
MNTGRDHRWAQGRLSAYIDGELPARHDRRLRAHEEICPECAELIRTLQALLIALSSLRMAPEAGLAVVERTVERVRARLGEWE